MVQSIINIRQYLLQIATNCNLPSNICVFQLLSADNEAIIESLIDDYNIDFVDATTSGIKALHFDKMNEYYNKGYFIFQNENGTRCYAVNNIVIIKEKYLDEQTDIPV